MEERQEASSSGKRFAGIQIPADLKRSHFFNLYVASFFVAQHISLKFGEYEFNCYLQSMYERGK